MNPNQSVNVQGNYGEGMMIGQGGGGGQGQQWFGGTHGQPVHLQQIQPISAQRFQYTQGPPLGVGGGQNIGPPPPHGGYGGVGGESARHRMSSKASLQMMLQQRNQSSQSQVSWAIPALALSESVFYRS